MQEPWADECDEKKDDDKCIINIFCGCNKDEKPSDQCEVKWHDKKHDGKCIINIFCKCSEDKKHDFQYDHENKY